jgi:hypothetical protein
MYLLLLLLGNRQDLGCPLEALSFESQLHAERMGSAAAAGLARLLLDYRAASSRPPQTLSGVAAVRREASPKEAGAGVGRVYRYTPVIWYNTKTVIFLFVHMHKLKKSSPK